MERKTSKTSPLQCSIPATISSNPSLQALNYTTPSTQPDLQFCLAKICFYSKYCPSANIAVEDGQSQTDTLRHFKFQTFHPAWLDSTGSEQLHGNCMECPSALSECREPTLTHQMSISVIFMIFVTNCSTWLKLQWAMGTNKVKTLMIYRSCKINTYNYTTFRSIRNQVARPKACHTGSFCKGYKDWTCPLFTPLRWCSCLQIIFTVILLAFWVCREGPNVPPRWWQLAKPMASPLFMTEFGPCPSIFTPNL